MSTWLFQKVPLSLVNPEDILKIQLPSSEGQHENVWIDALWQKHLFYLVPLLKGFIKRWIQASDSAWAAYKNSKFQYADNEKNNEDAEKSVSEEPDTFIFLLNNFDLLYICIYFHF